MGSNSMNFLMSCFSYSMQSKYRISILLRRNIIKYNGLSYAGSYSIATAFSSCSSF